MYFLGGSGMRSAGVMRMDEAYLDLVCGSEPIIAREDECCPVFTVDYYDCLTYVLSHKEWRCEQSLCSGVFWFNTIQYMILQMFKVSIWYFDDEEATTSPATCNASATVSRATVSQYEFIET